jgi:hypothetical protein
MTNPERPQQEGREMGRAASGNLTSDIRWPREGGELRSDGFTDRALEVPFLSQRRGTESVSDHQIQRGSRSRDGFVGAVSHAAGAFMHDVGQVASGLESRRREFAEKVGQYTDQVGKMVANYWMLPPEFRRAQLVQREQEEQERQERQRREWTEGDERTYQIARIGMGVAGGIDELSVPPDELARANRAAQEARDLMSAADGRDSGESGRRDVFPGSEDRENR